MDSARLEVAQASRVLAAHGTVDAFGHVSRRSPERADRFLMSRSRAPALVAAGDVLEHDLDGNPVGEPGARVFLERFIHAEIYRARPDVHAVVHSHSPDVVPFTVVPTARVQPICHLCGFLEGVGAPFDVADCAGPASDLLVRDPALGAAFARHLGSADVSLMRGHGFTAVGPTVAAAVFRAIYTALNCRLQSRALALGQPTYLSEGEATACEAATSGQMDRAWDLWLHELGPELHPNRKDAS